MLPISFERNLYREVVRYKQEHPGALEARTQERKRLEENRKAESKQ